MTELKTLKEIDGCDCGCCARTAIAIDELKAEAVKHLKIKKEINTADWVEFFGVEEEFGELCFGKEEDLK